MISLFLDTSAHNMVVAVYRNYELLKVVEEVNDNHLSERFLPAIKETLKSLNIKVSDITELIVVNGPGSFTGIRIGVTIAKTMAWAQKLPIKVISELKVLSTVDSDLYVAPHIDARRDCVFGGLYHNGSPIMDDGYYTVPQYFELINQKVSKNEVEYLSYDNVIVNSIKPQINYQKLAYSFEKLPIMNPHEVNPNYLKRTEAEENLDDKRS